MESTLLKFEWGLINNFDCDCNGTFETFSLQDHLHDEKRQRLRMEVLNSLARLVEL